VGYYYIIVYVVLLSLHGRWVARCTVGGPFVAQSVGCYCVVMCVVLLLLHGRWAVCCTVGGLLLCYIYIVFSGFVIWSVIDVWNLPLEGEC
jgi:hypothetical protein